MTEKNIHFIFVNEVYNLKIIFNDLLKDDRVTVLNGPCKEISNPLLLFLRKLHCHPAINRYIELPFKFIWSDSLRSIPWDLEKEYIVLFTNSSIYPLKAEYLLALQRKYHIKYVLHLNDPWDSTYSSKVREYVKKINFDYIFTVDNGDAEKYGFLLSESHYSMLVDTQCVPLQYDLYFTGQNKGRLDFLHKIYNKLKEGNVSSLFRVARVKKNEQRCIGIVYNKMVPYQTILEEIKKSNCILEVLSPGMTGASLRYNEAVCYNKKLLTNNKGIVDLPFYNPKYMRIFEKSEEIDCEWIKERIPVDYHYDGSFSPVKLLDRIISLEEQKGRDL